MQFYCEVTAPRSAQPTRTQLLNFRLYFCFDIILCICGHKESQHFFCVMTQ